MLIEMKTRIKEIFDVNRAMDYVFSILKYTGHYPFDSETKLRRTYLLYYFIMYGTMLISESIYLWIVFGDIDKMAETMYLYITHMGIFYKSYNIYMRYPTMCKLVKDLGVTNRDQISDRRRNIVKKARKGFGTLICGYYTCAFFFWLLTVISPLVQGGVALPLGCWYPFDHSKPGWYQLAFVQQTISIFIIAGVTLALDCVLIFLMQQTGTQLDLLRETFLHLGEEVGRIAGDFVGQQDIDENKIRDRLLEKAIHHHQDLIRFITIHTKLEKTSACNSELVFSKRVFKIFYFRTIAKNMP